MAPRGLPRCAGRAGWARRCCECSNDAAPGAAGRRRHDTETVL